MAPGARIPVDGTVTSGRSEIDPSLLTGETMPELVAPGAPVRAGMLNLSGPLELRADALGEELRHLPQLGLAVTVADRDPHTGRPDDGREVGRGQRGPGVGGQGRVVEQQGARDRRGPGGCGGAVGHGASRGGTMKLGKPNLSSTPGVKPRAGSAQPVTASCSSVASEVGSATEDRRAAIASSVVLMLTRWPPMARTMPISAGVS